MMSRRALLMTGVVLLLAGCGGATQQQATTAPTVAAAATQAAPAVKAGATTVAAAATQAAPALQTAQPTIVAAATQAVPTISAAATQVAPAVKAAGTSAPTIAAAAGTAVASSPLQIVGFAIDPTDPKLQLRNTGTSAVDVSGWKLRAGTTDVTLPANAVVRPGETMTLHFSQGTSAGNDVYLGTAALTLATGLRPGGQIALVNAQGQVVNQFMLP